MMLILLAGEHRVDAFPQSRVSCELEQKREGFVGDAILGVIQFDAGGGGREPLAACGIFGEQLAEMQLANFSIVGFEGLPRGLPMAECVFAVSSIACILVFMSWIVLYASCALF